MRCNRPGRMGAGALAAMVLLVAACSEGPTRSIGATTTRGTAVRVAGPSGEWPTFGHDLANDRFNPSVRAIDAGSAGSLATAWHRDGLKGVSSTPAVVGDTVYFGDWNGVVHAASIHDGTDVWTAKLGSSIMSSATVEGDAVYVASNRELARLKRTTGEMQWKVETSDHPIAISPAAPVVVDGLVLQGVASGELMVPRDKYSFRGNIAAYDAATGERRWQFFFTAGDATSGAGVGIWSTPSIDRERGLLYVGSGNTYEPPASEHADAIVALRYRTGELAWKHQFTHPDVWSMGNREGLDADVGAGPNLWEANGRALVGAGDKRGVYHALDRTTGEKVWEQSLTPGSALGGVIGTSAYGEGRLYVASNIGNEANNAPTGESKVFALDATTGAIQWQVPLAGAVFAPVSAIPGVVLVASTAGTMKALDARDGRELWSFAAPDQVGSGASVVGDTIYWGYGYALFGSGSGIGGLYAFRPGGSVTGGGSTGSTRPLSRGAELFRTSCSSCHGPRGQGGTGPDLRGVDGRLSVEEHVELVRRGRNQMPAFEGVLDEEELRLVVDYERTELQRSGGG